jgi:trimethylguanosine synthase
MFCWSHLYLCNVSLVSVIAIDLDPIKLRCAKRNAEVYGVADRISFICSDFFHVAPTLKADAIFLSPPWGGPSYLETEVFDLTVDLKPDGFKIFAAAQKISPNIAYFVPRNTSVPQVF